MEWINVEDRLPNMKGYYSVFTNDFVVGLDGIKRQFPYNAFYENGNWIGGTGLGISPLKNVTYWMPIPKLPLHKLEEIAMEEEYLTYEQLILAIVRGMESIGTMPITVINPKYIEAIADEVWKLIEDEELE